MHKTVLVALFLVVVGLMAVGNDHVPLPDVDEYQGYAGQLYPGGNAPPPAYAALIDAERSALGSDGHIVILCLGMSNMEHTCGRFSEMVAADPNVNDAVKIVNAGQPGRAQQAWDGGPTGQVWDNADKRLSQSGETPAAVDVVFYFNAWGYPNEPDFFAYANTMRGSLVETMESIGVNYPNTRLIYVTSRESATFAVTDLNPEPWPYWDGWAFKWLIDERMAELVDSPLILWQAYQYDPTWPASYYREDDGVHLSDAGLGAAAALWLAYFSSEAWFYGTPLPTPTPGPTATPGETATPTVPPTVTPTPDGSTPTPCSGWSPECFCLTNPTARICQP